MTLLLLVRHAHTDVAGRRLTGWLPGVHLSERGREQALRLAERLEGVPITAVYSSPLERCLETAHPLAEARGLAIRNRDDLGEIRFGAWTDRTLAQLRRTKLWRAVQVAPSTVRFPDGESYLEVQGRALREVERIARAHPRQTVAVVSHADVIRLLLAHFAGVHPDLFQRIVVDPASVSVVALGDGVRAIHKVNDTGDLSALRSRGRGRGPGRAKVGG
ncbi:MAG TPA: MSMEG_4193 family putative phosphomutase [Actinomycetota bacterium]|nr:MSMEG_4193 family putative phosphomutase [Actinomycetota bacterium]